MGNYTNTWEITDTSGLSASELNVLDAVTAGTAAASKAVVLDASKGVSTITSATVTTLTAPNIAGDVTFADGTTDVDIASHDGTNGLQLGGALVTASALEINQAADISGKFVAAGSTLSATVAAHNGRVINLDTATGSVVTLPAATGTGAVFKFRVTALATSNSHIIQTSAGTEHMQGFIFTMDDTTDNAQAFFAVSGTSDTITLNRTTTGSVTLGETITLTDIASTLWGVEGFISNTGTAATPFSAAV